MTKIVVDATSTEENVRQMQKVIGGTISERWGEYVLTVDSEFAKGSIRFITFDWGVNLLEYDIEFLDEINLMVDASEFNPIHFIYCLEGACEHRFDNQSKENLKMLDQYQSVILTSKDGGYNHWSFPKGMHLAINFIQITRRKFLKKRLNNVDELNKRLYRVFLDSDHEKQFAFFGAYDLRLADDISELRKVKTKGLARIMQIEGLVYQILSKHILQHDNVINNTLLPTTLKKNELKIVRGLAQLIDQDVSIEYSLDKLSLESGLSQAKLQGGFKLLYTRTVAEYVRHARLEVARDYIKTTDMNISEIVYSIGLSSRSYFSKIFKKKYGLSPREFQKKVKTFPDLSIPQ